MKSYCENYKKHIESTHSKMLVLISKKKKVKSKCTEYLTDKTFSEKINDKYELEQLVKHFFIY